MTTLDQEKDCSLTTFDGIKLHYRLYRPGAHRPLLVLIHGVASNLSRWSEFVEYTRLSKDWDILRLDLRGHDGSLYRGVLRFRDWARDICEILDREQYQHAVLVGHSLGAQVAMDLTYRYPSRVAGLALVDPVFFPALHADKKRLYRLRALVWIPLSLILLLNRLGLHRRTIPHRDLRKLDEDTRATLLSAGATEEMIAQYSSPWPDIKHFPLANYVQELFAAIRPLPAADPVNLPVLTLLATEPTYTDIQTTEAIANRRFPGGRIARVKANHWPLTEAPEETRKTIEDWCDSLKLTNAQPGAGGES